MNDWSYISGASKEAVEIALNDDLIGFRRDAARVFSVSRANKLGLEIVKEFLIVKGQKVTGDGTLIVYRIDDVEPLRYSQIKHLHFERTSRMNQSA